MSIRLNCIAIVVSASGMLSMAQQGTTKPVLKATPPADTVSASPQASIPTDTPPDPSASSATYILGSGDAISVLVWKEPGMSNPNIPVRPDGMISLSLLGDLPAAGFTPMHLSEDIAERLKKYITDPRVTVTVLSVHTKEIYMLGEVAHVGPVAITPDMTPLQAIAAAGGLSPFAKRTRIYILRTEGGKKRKIPFDYKKALKSGDEQGVSLVAGDTIVVP